ncbi:hypothetical protein HJC23_012909 [Cyclotella cryptica]|uniref:rhomboid protease n=1 Tax=Cyclotella cryptica TaxID=29204 RepID=A0ABD3Q2T1_9STRA|eukprot:CCRYP_009254-RA/>CCRYP_009254-RA protein AED:0.03 eAED:0.03 QI:286/1/1/1/1/1/3/98/840
MEIPESPSLSPSPPISPLTYDPSNEDLSAYQWSYEHIGHSDSDTINNKATTKHERIVSEELGYIVSALEATPKAGVASDRRRLQNQSNNSNMNDTCSVRDVMAGERNGETNQNTDADDDESAASKTSRFSIRRKRVGSNGSVASFSTVWRRIYKSYDVNDGADQVKRNDTSGTSHEDGGSDDASLRERGENDLFALEVGLMFSADDGDTIANADLYSQCISNILTMDSAENGCTGDGAPSSDLSAYLNQHRHTTFVPNNLTSFDTSDDDDDRIGNYIHNPNYAIPQQSEGSRPQQTNHNHQQEQFFHDNASDTNTTIRDDHGNRLPPNAKAILAIKKNHRLNNNTNPTSTNHPSTNNLTTSQQQQHVYNNTVFPPIQKTSSDSLQSKEEMEKRLRDLAGQLSIDWRSGPTTFIASPALARRLRDFQFAREKRRKKYGVAKPWGILGLYDHLAGVRVDVEWAEDAAWRRLNGKPYLTWGDFESHKNSGNNRPFFTYFIVSMCTSMMFAAWFVNGWRFEPITVNPMIGPSAETLLRLGAKDSYSIVHDNEIWRLASPMVLHAGLIHYILNMFALWYVGKAVELIHGHFQAIVQFVVPAIGGTILSAIFLPQYITVGASGGIFGLIGACISDVNVLSTHPADIVMNWNLLFNEFVNERGARISHARVLMVLFLDIIVNCLLGLTPFVDNFTHLGGMIYGFLCGLSTIQMVSLRFFGDDRHCAHKAKLFIFRFLGLIISIAGIITSSIFLFSGDGVTNPCPSCTYMSCIAFPPWTGKNDKWWYCDECSQATAEGTLNTATGKFIEMDLTCPDETIVNVKLDETWPQDEVGLEAMLPMLCRERCF